MWGGFRLARPNPCDAFIFKGREGRFHLDRRCFVIRKNVISVKTRLMVIPGRIYMMFSTLELGEFAINEVVESIQVRFTHLVPKVMACRKDVGPTRGNKRFRDGSRDEEGNRRTTDRTRA